MLCLWRIVNGKRKGLDDQAGRLADAGADMINWMLVFDRSGMRLNADDEAQCWHFWIRFCTLTQHLPALFLATRHLIIHLFDQLETRGNPKYYSSWMDERLNRLLEGSCRQLSQLTFEPVLLVKMEHLLAKQVARTRRNRVR